MFSIYILEDRLQLLSQEIKRDWKENGRRPRGVAGSLARQDSRCLFSLYRWYKYNGTTRCVSPYAATTLIRLHHSWQGIYIRYVLWRGSVLVALFSMAPDSTLIMFSNLHYRSRNILLEIPNLFTQTQQAQMHPEEAQLMEKFGLILRGHQ